MCSIIGCLSTSEVTPVLLNGLKKMEYRGYDSAGIAVASKNKILIKKGVGKVKEVEQELDLKSLNGYSGIGHTRWATHGAVSDINAHPHMCNDDSFVVVHNGIIENYKELKNKLEKSGYVFKSNTDTEIIPNLLSHNFRQIKDIKKSLIKTISELKGNYSFIVMSKNGNIIAVKHYEPLILGIQKDRKRYTIASDLLGFMEIEDIVDIENKQFVMISSEGFKVYDFEGNEVPYSVSRIPQKIKDANKGDFEHFTLKEIHEQTNSISLAGNESEQAINEFIKTIKGKNIVLTGSGTSYYAGLLARYLFPMYINNSIDVIKSSEMKFSEHFLKPNSVLIAISQSGESADVLESVEIAKRNEMSITSIVNAMTSSLARESNVSIGLNCGPEIGVAATKSFTSQLAIFYKIADRLSKEKIKPKLDKVSLDIAKLLRNSSRIKDISKELSNAKDIYVLGRGIHYPIAMEGALKLKELTYIHAEGVSFGELKHGPLALMDESAYVIVINPEDETYQENLSNIHEIKARGAKVIGIANKNSDMYDQFIEIPTVPELLYPLVEIIPFQLLAYYITLERGLDPDYPRNLAKCVTVK